MLSLAGNELIIILAALVVGSLVKGVTGMGLPLVAIPVMAGFLGVERAVVIMVIPALVLNAWLAWSHRDGAGEVPELARLLLWGCLGTFAGTWVLYVASERVLAMVLASCTALYVILRLTHAKMSLPDTVRRRAAPGVGLLFGVFQGATGIAGPIVGAYLHALDKPPRTYVFSFAAVFTALGLGHFTALFVLRMYTPQLLLESLMALIPAFVMIPVGVALRGYLNRAWFDMLVLVMIAAMTVRIFYNGCCAA